MRKIFIFDVDGVLLNLWIVMKASYESYINKNLSDDEWDEIIESFLKNPAPYKDFGEYFDNSGRFDMLPPMDPYMANLIFFKLFPRYADLAIITSINNRDDLKERRRRNIKAIYGNIFKEIICVGRGNSKEEEIIKLVKGYDFSLFIDDNLKNVAKSVGLVDCPVWYENKHHLFQLEEIDPSGIHMIKDAKELEELIVKQCGPLTK